MSSEKNWLGSAKLVGACTLLSRVLGLVRDMAMAALFGSGVVMDAFVLAFMVPNLFRRLFGEGAMGAAFVPVFTDYTERKGDAEAGRFFRACFTASLALLGAITCLAWLLCAVAPGWLTLNATWRLFFPLLSALFPYMPLICLTALTGAALNVRRHFLGPAMAPVLLNVFWLLGLWLAAPIYGVWAVAVAVLAGGAAQLAMTLFILRGRGVRPGIAWEPRHEGVRRTARMVLPAVAGLAAMQVNILVDGLIAQFCVPGHGANSALYYGNRLAQFPLGVIGAALGTAIFPTLATRAARGDDQGLLEVMRQGLRVTLFIVLPVTTIAFVLSTPIVRLIFQRGAFGGDATTRASWVLSFYCLGLVAYCSNQILTRVFYAKEDSKTPVKVSVAMVGLNFTLNIILVWPMREAGLALATAVSAFVNIAALLWILRRRLGALALGELVGTVWRCAAAAAACGACAWAVLSALPEGTSRLALCALPMIAGGLVYLALAWFFRMPELQEVAGPLRLGQRRRTKG